MLRRLLDADWKPPASLRFALLGGAACPPGLQREALDRGVPIAPTFGMTETCSQICTLLPREVDAHLGTVGRSIPGATLKIRDADDGSLPNGQVGRIWVMGPMVARSPEMENSLDGEGGPWLKTSDLGSLDNDGFLTVVGRADDMILTGGENVAPSEIEQLLVLRNDVAEAAVVGIGDPEWGERIVAAVVPGAGRSPDAEVLSAYLSDHLDAFKVPKSIAILDELPLIGPGKVDRDMLQQLLSVNPAGAGDR
jgi:O-succinylbenzoic acid--CoA ligase